VFRRRILGPSSGPRIPLNSAWITDPKHEDSVFLRNAVSCYQTSLPHTIKKLIFKTTKVRITRIRREIREEELEENNVQVLTISNTRRWHFCCRQVCVSFKNYNKRTTFHFSKILRHWLL